MTKKCEICGIYIETNKHDRKYCDKKKCKKIAQKAVSKKWREENRESLLKKKKEYYEKNKPKLLKIYKKYRDEHKKEIAIRLENWHKKHLDYKYSPVSKFNQFIQNNKRRKKEVKITFDEWMSFKILPCIYCGEIPEGMNGTLDRIDNNKGYIEDNIVPACLGCNRARHDYFTVEEFKKIGEVIIKIKEERKNNE